MCAKDDWLTKGCFYLQGKHILYLPLPALKYLWLFALRLSSQRKITERYLCRSLFIFHWTEESAYSGGWCIAGIWTYISSCLMRTVLEQHITPGRITSAENIRSRWFSLILPKGHVSAEVFEVRKFMKLFWELKSSLCQIQTGNTVSV